MYTQCRLRRRNVRKDGVNATSITTSWIPQPFAKKGKALKLKMKDGWENGWVVAEVFATKEEKGIKGLPVPEDALDALDALWALDT